MMPLSTTAKKLFLRHHTERCALVLAALVLLTIPAKAEPIPDDSCSAAGAVTRAAGPEASGGIYILVCNGSTWKAVNQFFTDGKELFQVNSDSGACNADKQGRIRYTSASDTWEYCTGTVWSTFVTPTTPTECNIVGMSVGSICPDGTVFAGFPPESYYPMFTTRCDAGKTWTGSCTGTAVTKPWNNGNSTGRVTTNLTSNSDGEGNTAQLSSGGTYQDSDSGTGGIQPHQAAQYCTDLVINGWDDWYLPSAVEMYTMYLHESAIGNFTNAYFWTSTEINNSSGRYVLMGYGSSGSDTKNNSNNIRCVRRNN